MLGTAKPKRTLAKLYKQNEDSVKIRVLYSSKIHKTDQRTLNHRSYITEILEKPQGLAVMSLYTKTESQIV